MSKRHIGWTFYKNLLKCFILTTGYADSTNVEIDELGLVSDVMETFKWVYERANGTPIFGWGHSLGTG